jgi:hypothetical protein
MKWRPEISLVWLGTILFFAAELVLFWLFITHPSKDYRENIQFFASIVGGGFALFAYLKGLEVERGKTADNFKERWSRTDFRVSVNRTRAVVEKKLASKDYGRPTFDPANATDAQIQMRGDIIAVLTFFEEIATSVAAKKASEDELREFFGAVLPTGYDAFEGFVLAERNFTKEFEYYKPTQLLVERWTNVRRPDR